ncbi:H-type small acid-soluble spore protein [Dethiothermospora halolimnae]|uniref:H-type small acid-soluble spore protein n=1 Tax=Dethiothermospora halolimnae TaxID=3114390 RepID=UPI003CCBFFA6
MDKIRAQEIVNSNIEIEVFYNGDSVWIKSLDSNTADVENIKTHKSMKVPLTDLKEDMTIS